MIKPDVIVTWPKNCDYPIWRQFIKENRERFNLVIVVFMEPNFGFDYSSFVRESMHGGYNYFLDSPPVESGKDWRNVAVNAGLNHSYNADWVWFTEQDFYPYRTFWKELNYREDEGCEIIGNLVYTRLHPSCLFVKRSILKKTKRNFSAKPPDYDHFGLFQKDIEDMKNVKKGVISNRHFVHMNGLSHNLNLIASNKKPNYEPKMFYAYIIRSLQANVPIHDHYKKICERYLNV